MKWLLAAAVLLRAAHGLITSSQVRLNTGIDMQLLSRRASSPSTAPPVLFVHGTFHGAWCWENWLELFSETLGVDCHAVSLRGTSGTPAPGQKNARIGEHVADLRALVDDGPLAAPPVLVGHSFGGAFVLKYLEAGGAAAGAALLCSVPPSGNTPMVLRFLRRSLRKSWLITKGFALKSAATSAADARALFFDERLADAELAGYMERFDADSRCPLDVGDFNATLPIGDGKAGSRAAWLTRAPPARIVLGAEFDAVVDAEGIDEAAAFLGVPARTLPGMPHDVMLNPGWEAAAEPLVGWYRGEFLSAEG